MSVNVYDPRTGSLTKVAGNGGSSGSSIIKVTQGEYNALSDEEKSKGVYVVEDAYAEGMAYNVGYSNTSSGLGATNVQGAIDEVNSNFDALTTHSLEEEEIGTFFGKTLYRKSFALKTPSTKNATTKLTNNSPLNGCTIVKISGAAYNTSGNFGIPCCHYENTSYISTWVSGGDVYCNTNVDLYLSLDLYVTVEYTK